MATQANLAALAEASDVDRWTAWGKASDGLQLAFLPLHTDLIMPPGAVRRRVREGDRWVSKVFPIDPDVRAVIAVRNTTTKPVELNLYAPDRYLDITLKSTDGKTVKDDFDWLAHVESTRFEDSKATQTLRPGEALLIGAQGVVRWPYIGHY